MKIIDKINSFGFDETISTTTEVRRLEFIAKFPIEKIQSLTLEEYAIGNNNRESFCYLLESDNLLFTPSGIAKKFGLYRNNVGRYVIANGNRTKEVDVNELNEFFENIKQKISEILNLMLDNNINEIQNYEIPISQNVIIKILCIYFPDKFIPIGSFDILQKCAEDLDLDKFYFNRNHHIELNYLIREKINSLIVFNDWTFSKIGSYLWSLFGNQENITKIEDVKINSKSNDSSLLEYFRTNESSKITKSIFIKPTLNTILYGPPGTGKTYNTILHAAKILSETNELTFEEAQRIFNENLGDRIEFITFHQNFSYEDFIQGIRPDISEESNLKFKKIDGVFKRIADRALENLNLSDNNVEYKRNFDDVLHDLLSPLIEGNEDKIEIPTKNTTFYINEVTDRSIRILNQNGNSNNTLSKETLKKMYYKGKNDIIIGGLQSYYDGILKMLFDKSHLKGSISNQKQNYVIIIDEINRANISRVFGELITLIEEDKRSHGKIPLSAILPSGDKFVVPSNLYIIGTMNTADKSIALLDIALRRRFEFKAFYPDYSLINKQDSEILKNLNAKIIEKKSHDFQIGHSFFMDEKYDLISTMNNKVIPLISEYFMNDKNDILEILNSVFGKSNDLRIVDNSWPIKLEKIN